MPAPMYESCQEIIDMIGILMDKRKDLFEEMTEYIYPEMFIAGLRFDKVAPAKQKWTVKIEGIRGSKTLLTDKKYLIHGYKDRWDACSREKKFALVANMLRRVAYPTKEELMKLEEKGEDYEYGKLVKPDVEDFKSFIQTFGIDWMEDPIIPDISEDTSLKV